SDHSTAAGAAVGRGGGVATAAGRVGAPPPGRLSAPSATAPTTTAPSTTATRIHSAAGEDWPGRAGARAGTGSGVVTRGLGEYAGRGAPPSAATEGMGA